MPAAQKIALADRMFKEGFVTALTKYAATVDELQAGLRRLNPLRVPVPKNTARLAQENPLTAAVNATKERGALSGALVTAGGAATVPKSRVLQSLGAQGENAPEWLHRHGGNVLIPRGVGGSTNYILETGRVPSVTNVSGQGHRATNIAIGLHEGFERAVRPGQLAQGYGHLSPDVLMKEHNLMSKMTGPGSDEARRVMDAFRATSGDKQGLHAALEEMYGPRVKEYLSEGARIPAALRRDFTRRAAGGEANWPYRDPNRARWTPSRPPPPEDQKLKDLLTRSRAQPLPVSGAKQQFGAPFPVRSTNPQFGAKFPGIGQE